MRLQAAIEIYLPSETVRRDPSFWDRMKQALGVQVDLSSTEARAAIDATALVEQVRKAFRLMAIDNAVALIIDEQVVFSDAEGKPADLPDLVLALAEHTSVFGEGFRALRFGVEHEQAGLRLLIETQARTTHRVGEPTLNVRVGARVQELEPRPGETAEAYRERIAPLAGQSAALEAHRSQFQALMACLADALRAAFPEGEVEERAPSTTVVKPSARPKAGTTRLAPWHPNYDPYLTFYPSPFESILSSVMIGSFLSSAFHPHDITVVHPSGAPLAPADELADHDADLAIDAPDPGFDLGDVENDVMEGIEGLEADGSDDSSGGGSADMSDGADGDDFSAASGASVDEWYCVIDAGEEFP